MRINHKTRELQVKVVYYGPAEAGKTTNIQQIFRQVPPQHRSDLTVLDTDGDRTLFFDYFQLALGRIGGYKPRVNLYTVPGQAVYAITRKVVLRGADAVVFVADSDPARAEDNLDAWRQLHQHLNSLGLGGKTPIVVQWNKRDLPGAMSTAELSTLLDLDERYPVFEAVAVDNRGVRETFDAILKRIFYRRKQPA